MMFRTEYSRSSSVFDPEYGYFFRLFRVYGSGPHTWFSMTKIIEREKKLHSKSKIEIRYFLPFFFSSKAM